MSDHFFWKLVLQIIPDSAIHFWDYFTGILFHKNRSHTKCVASFIYPLPPPPYLWQIFQAKETMVEFSILSGCYRKHFTPNSQCHRLNNKTLIPLFLSCSLHWFRKHDPENAETRRKILFILAEPTVLRRLGVWML